MLRDSCQLYPSVKRDQPTILLLTIALTTTKKSVLLIPNPFPNLTAISIQWTHTLCVQTNKHTTETNKSWDHMGGSRQRCQVWVKEHTSSARWVELVQWLRLLTIIPADGVRFPARAAVFFKSLSLFFMCSDQHVKYQMPRGFPSTSSLLLDYHVKQYTHTGLWRLQLPA